MTLTFNAIPPNLRVPLWYAEINPAQAPYVSQSRLLLVGQKLGSGSAVANEPVHVQGDPRTLAGLGSMLVGEYEAARANAPFHEIWFLPLEDNPAGVKATGSIKVGKTIVPSLVARVLSTVDISDLATSAPLVVDGQTLVAGDLVLQVGSSIRSQNGLYEVITPGTGSNGEWQRAAGLDADAEFVQDLGVTITAGAVSAGAVYRLTSFPVSVGSTPINFVNAATIGITNAATVGVWIGETRVQAAAFPVDNNASLAARLVQAINYFPELDVTATINALDNSRIDLLARHAGTAYNSVRLTCDYYGTEGPLSGSLFTLTQMSGGSGDPDVTAALANLGDDEFDWIVGPYADMVTLAKFSALLDGQSGRWSPYQQLYGHYLGVTDLDVTAAMTLGNMLNDPHLSVFPVHHAQSPIWRWAGALGGRMAQHLSDAPELSRPLQTLNLKGIMPPKLVSDRPNKTNRQSLYFKGMSGYHVDGKTFTASIDRIITTYRLNEWGSPDPSWLDVETLAQNMFAIRYLRADVTGAWGRAALVDTNPHNIEGFCSPDDMRRTIIHAYKKLEVLGVVENSDIFESLLIVEKDQRDANRMNVFLPADQVNQLRIIATNYVSHLQYQQAA